MLIVFLIIFIVLCFFSVVFDREGCANFCVFIIIALVIGIGACCYDISEGKIIDEKIAMYQEENSKIESNIDALVKQYMQYETTTFGELKPESSINLVSLYPDLKADTLVNKQIEIYTTNTETIKQLKEKKITISLAKWWVYFGG